MLYVMRSKANQSTYLKSDGQVAVCPDDARKFSTRPDAEICRDQLRNPDACEVVLLTDALAWESGMRPAWEIEAQRRAAEEAKAEELCRLQYHSSIEGWVSSLRFDGVAPRKHIEYILSTIKEESRNRYRVVPYRPQEASQ